MAPSVESPMSERLLRPAVCCPRCGAPPALRLVSRWRDWYLAEEPDAEVLSYKCHIRICGTIYPITAGALKGAA